MITEHLRAFIDNVPFCVSAFTNLKELSLSETWYVPLYVTNGCIVNLFALSCSYKLFTHSIHLNVLHKC